jgi:creatinine amidohydrolase
MLLTDITMTEFEQYLMRTQTILFPYGSVEEHGMHLPLFTDTLIVYEVLRRVALKREVLIAPPVHYGVCTSTGAHAGTLSISPETLRRLTFDLIKDAYQKGLRNIFLISGHAGGIHMSAMKEVAEILMRELIGLKMAVFSLYDSLLWDKLAAIAETKNDSHAGEIETSLVLALTPELVKGTSPEEYPQFPHPFIVTDKLKYWPGGVWGNPEKASAEKGKKVLSLMVDSVVELIDRIQESE